MVAVKKTVQKNVEKTLAFPLLIQAATMATSKYVALATH